MTDQPRASRRGWLKNGNPPGDFTKAPRCGAKTRSGGTCGCPAMRNGRCRIHGGLSTGPRTPEGLARSRTARLVHGQRSREMIELRRRARDAVREVIELRRRARDAERETKMLARLLGEDRRTR